MAEYDPSGLPDMSEQQPPTNGEYSYNPAAAGDDDDDDDDDYDPSSFDTSNIERTTQPMQVDAQPAPAEAKPKTVGGFILEDDDDEEDEAAAPPPSQLNGTEGTQSGLGAVGVSNAANEDVHIASELTQDSAAQQQASLNGSASLTTAPTDASVPVFDTPALPVTLPAAQSQAATEGKASAISPTAAGVAPTASVSATPKPAVNGVTAPPEAPHPATQRLPHDKVGRLEDRIKEDPKAEPEAWWELIQHYRDKDQLDNARKVFDRMLEVWPTSPKIYLAYLAMEFPPFERQRIDTLFSHALPIVPSLALWAQYLGYLRRVFPLIPDPTGDNRRIITQGFDAVLDAVGHDPSSGSLWTDYLDFLKSGPGDVTKAGWQDAQKADGLRVAYQKAVKIPHGEVVRLWKEYDGFETSVNKSQARKVLGEVSPDYMQARTAARQLESILEGLVRGEEAVATLPPLEGCEGDDGFALQVQKWRAWVEWERSDPLLIKDEGAEGLALYRKRILNVYKQACISLRFWPQIWYDALTFCLEVSAQATTQGNTTVADGYLADGEKFLDEGLKANPESVLLTLKKTDRTEEAFGSSGNVTDEAAIANGEKLEAIFEPCLKALYELHKKTKEHGQREEAEVRAYFTSLRPEDGEGEEKVEKEDGEGSEKDGDSPVEEKPKSRAELLAERVKVVQAATREQLDMMKRTISYIWIAKMRAFRRIQGLGAPNRPKKGFRGVFAEARPRGQLSADVYVASALMEWHCYKDASALKIFERGLKLFPTEEGFAIEYIKHLISVNDLVNARVVFETTVTKILGASSVEEARRREKVRPLLEFMHAFESQYGDLAAVKKLEGRMKELYPEEGVQLDMRVFSGRFEMGGFDGMGVQLILSSTQARPKVTLAVQPPLQQQMGMPGIPTIAPSVEDRLQLGPSGPFMASPKRPLDDDMDMDGTPRKFMRAESPLKGAAGRRVTNHQPTASNSNNNIVLGSQSTIISSGAGSGFMTKQYVPPTSPAYAGGATGAGAGGEKKLPNEIMYLLTILPHASRYNAVQFDPVKVVDLLKRLDFEAVRARYGGGLR